ncbi:MAG: thiopurine S-methyltransferase [Alphaproteobacteria bacterium]|nr:thiopurine S-methyltransferase [Alphaproteobacteria bacterium]
MKPEFWINAWETGRRGFHMSEVHPDLPAHGALFGGEGAVFVPLCGATHDLAWLRDQGHHAVGIELSPLALAELAEREGLEESGRHGPFTKFEGPGITVLQGDYFHLTPALLGPIAGIWDRAALVALHPDQRADYVALQRALLGDRGRLLLNVFAYDQALTDGPPWSLDTDVVAALWPEAQLVEERPAELPPHFQPAVTRVYRTR